MATATHALTLEEFRTRYSNEKPYYEYWFGEAIQKSVSTISHGVLQQLLCALLTAAGYHSGSEIELRIDPNWQPKPDVIAWLSPIRQPYPTIPVDIVAEILSPDDAPTLVFEKCRQYQRIGIRQTFVFDPEAKVAWEWNATTEDLEIVSVLQLANSQTVPVYDIWRHLDRALT